VVVKGVAITVSCAICLLSRLSTPLNGCGLVWRCSGTLSSIVALPVVISASCDFVEIRGCVDVELVLYRCAAVHRTHASGLPGFASSNG